SGSQQIMENYIMKDLDMLNPQVENTADGMNLMTNVLAYDNNINAIGYNVRYHVLHMNPNPNVKLLMIHGIPPTDEMIQNRNYPLSGDMCVIFKATEPWNSKVRKIVRWLSSKAGKKVIQKGNYVPLK
ncbi:MAG: phosphate ABC transporter substrate-binding protein, partial [Bacteroidota bacterium]